MTNQRLVLLVSHTARKEALSATLECAEALLKAGITPVMDQQERAETLAHAKTVNNSSAESILELVKDVQESDLELAVVLGGDGTILKAAELVRASQTPLLGINLGHVGFLAESEKNEISSTMARVVAKDYLVKERMTLEVAVKLDGKEVYRTWALNEATVEKAPESACWKWLLKLMEDPYLASAAMELWSRLRPDQPLTLFLEVGRWFGHRLTHY
jgi:NAD+ kinase